MSEDVKKNLRTQGKYSDDRNFKNRDKRQKDSPVDKEPPGKKTHSQKRNSAGSKEQNVSLNEDPVAISVQYEENSNYSFEDLKDVKKPIEIKTAGLHTLSETANGLSTILYEPCFMESTEGLDYYDYMCEAIPWNEKNIVIHGMEYPQPRLVAWYGPFPYSYSGVILEPQEMPASVIVIKERVEAYLMAHDINVTLNSVLLNCYRDGKDSVSWHSDDELTMGVCPTIASVSLGETRKFEMRRKVRSYDIEISPDHVDQYFVQLTHGSLLIMNGSMQTDWQHRVPKEYHEKNRRINLTFRTVYSLEKIPSEIPLKEYNHRVSKSNETVMQHNKINFDEENFPSLSSTVNSFCSGTDDSLQEKFEVFKTEEGDKSMDCYDDASSFSNSNTDSCINNLNDEKPLIKPGMLNKNVHTNNSFAGDSDAMNAEESWDRNDSCDGNSYTNDGRMDESMESIVSNVNKYSCIEDIDPPFSLPSSSNLNVEAKEFVPSISPFAASEDVLYDDKSLKYLLNIDTGSLEDKVFLNYAVALNKQIIQQIDDFTYFMKDEFNVLSQLMEDDLTIKNQKLITKRMQTLVIRDYDRPPSNFRRYTKPNDKYTRQSHHVNEDYYNSNRSFSTQNRGSSSRGNNRGDEQYFNRENRNPSHRSDYNREEYSNTEGESSAKKNEYDGKEKVYSNRDRANSSRGNRFYRREDKNSNAERGDSIQENEYDGREGCSIRNRVNSNRGRGLNHREERNSNAEGDNSIRENEYDGREESSYKERENSSRGKGHNRRDEGQPIRKRGNPSQGKGYSLSRRGQSSRGRGNNHD